ncbi:DUF4232 domain-containing protein [Streptomyces sp. NPDC050610]|uniref:DUF4232 domain-containing protein n=1 Tax=Streptomyces sp. NPDC050610 TaxID=3157097 RepID=UPI00341974BD
MSASTTARTVRRRTLRVAAAALVAAAGLSLTACSGSDAGGSKAAGHTGANAAAESGGSGSKSSASGWSGLQGAGAQADDAKADSGNGAAEDGGKPDFCRTDDLMMEAVDSSPDKQTGDVTVQMTNKGGSTCSATGFAGVDLKDLDNTSASVTRADNQPRITNLKPGDTATFNISYPADTSGDSLANPTNILVTPPNESHSVSLKWPADALKPAGSYDDKIQVHPVGIAN